MLFDGLLLGLVEALVDFFKGGRDGVVETGGLFGRLGWGCGDGLGLLGRTGEIDQAFERVRQHNYNLVSFFY